MRRVAVLVFPLLLAGCALPPAVTVASLAADGVSYLATGKSTTDHAISAIAQEDCALVRAVREEAICVPKGAAVAGMTGPVQGRRIDWKQEYPEASNSTWGSD